MITLTGKKISEGIAIGKLTFYKRDIKEIKRIYVKDVEKEVMRFQKARQKALQELRDLYDSASKEVGEANAAIFEMQQMILEDQEIIRQITNIIVEHKLNAEYAVKNAVENVLASAAKSNKSYVQGHEADIKDVSTRVLRILARAWKDKMLTDEPFILAAGELYPSEAVKLDKSKILGFVTRYGTINSHTAVLARTKGIPSVIGLGESLKKEYEGKTIIIDGFEGKVYIEPDYTTISKMKQRQDENHTQVQSLERLKGKENITQSGQKIDVCANIGSREDIESVLRSDAGGIGLFRSEFIYLGQDHYPTEEEQFQIYKTVAETMAGRRVIIRTLDIGADKKVDYFNLDPEENPAMGYRAIRICLTRPEIFKTQLRALYRASVFGNISIMFPMIISVSEVRRIKEIMDEVKTGLRADGIAFSDQIETGIMIETPAAVMISRELAKEVDFFSVGTNDLTQYTLAIDRQNRNLDSFYDSHHPAVLSMIQMAAENAHAEGKWIGICGELAADLSLTERFLQMNIDELSVAPGMIIPLRKKIREL